MSKISVLIPVYNVEAYLKECLESVISQTEKDIEIICVDDASTDHSLEILKRYQEKDPRIQLICHETNQGICKTRKDAIWASEGDYLMFLDSDDYIASDACEKLYRYIQKTNADVIQFGAKLLYDETVSAELVTWVENFMEPSTEYIEGNILEKCFVENKLNVNLVNKIWKRTCCRQAVEYLSDEKIVAAEDRYMCFLFLYYTHSYARTRDKYYHYRLAAGVTGGDHLDLEHFEKRCRGAAVIEKVECFLHTLRIREQYGEVFECFSNDILWDCTDCWYRKLEEKDQPEGFRILLRFWDGGQIAGALARTFFENQADIEHRTCFPGPERIAIYYRHVGYRAMDDILKRYIDCYRDRNCEVTLITDSDAGEAGEQYLGCRLIHIPAATDANWDRYVWRSRALNSELQEADKLLYLSPTSHVMRFDRIVAESQGVEFQPAMDEYVLDLVNRSEKKILELTDDSENRLLESKIKYETELEKLLLEKEKLENEIRHIYDTKCGKMMKIIQNAEYRIRHVLKQFL